MTADDGAERVRSRNAMAEFDPESLPAVVGGVALIWRRCVLTGRWRASPREWSVKGVRVAALAECPERPPDADLSSS